MDRVGCPEVEEQRRLTTFGGVERGQNGVLRTCVHDLKVDAQVAHDLVIIRNPRRIARKELPLVARFSGGVEGCNLGLLEALPGGKRRILFHHVAGRVPADFADNTKWAAIFHKRLLVDILGHVFGVPRRPHFKAGIEFTPGKRRPLCVFVDARHFDGIAQLLLKQYPGNGHVEL